VTVIKAEKESIAEKEKTILQLKNGAKSALGERDLG